VCAQVVRILSLCGFALAFVLLPCPVSAQSVIAGVATDTTGAILPGVVVEVSSPALIEKTRSAVTNTDGRYTIVDLRPGEYVVTFSLPGFSTVKREGIVVAANVNVPVNAELKVGTVEETVTVSGATPMVDIQQASQRQVLARETLDALPTARSYLSTGAVVPTVKISRPDMGGIAVGQGSYLSARGKSSNDSAIEIDGLDVRISNGISQSGYNNFAMVQDVTYQTSAIGADSSAGGVRINMIPREGGNAFKGDFYIGGSNGWQANNITPELKARGLPTPDALKYLIDANPSVGGPIFKSKLWFFGSGRFNEIKVQPAGAHLFATGAPGYTVNDLHNLSGRITWQPSQRNKFTAYVDKAFKSQDHTTTFTDGAGSPPGVDWATATSTYHPSNYQLGYVKWTSPVTNKLLIESGFVFDVFNVVYNTPLPGLLKPYGAPEWYAGGEYRDLVLNTYVGAPAVSEQFARQPHYSLASSASYVTGSHTMKAGIQYRYQYVENMAQGGNADLVTQFRNGVPDSVITSAVPYIAKFHANETGLYAMDSWTMSRLTINPGIRFDYFRGGVDPTTSAAGRFVPQRQVGALSPVTPFFDITPRLSAVYDLFGNAKTALKFSASKYVTQLAATYYGPYNPLSQGTDTRIWLDTDLTPGTATASGRVLPTNGDRVAQDNEIGPSQNSRFGLAADQRADPNLKREYSWDYAISVQHQIHPRVSVFGGWYYTRSYNTQRTVNALRTLANYTPFQTPSPLNNGEMITVYRLDPLQVGNVDTLVTNSDLNHRDYVGYEVSVQTHWARGGTASAGWATERTRSVTCDTPNPNQLRYCDQTGALYQELGAVPPMPFLQEFKVSASQPLPLHFLVGVSFLSYPGGPNTGLLAYTGGPPPATWPGLMNTWTVPANVFPGGRTEVVSVPLIPPGTQFLDRWNQLDLSVRRTFRVGRYEFQPALDLFNVLNSSVVLGQNQNFGPALGAPTSTLQGRLVKFSAIVKF
jgi:hypothetical protein